MKLGMSRADVLPAWTERRTTGSECRRVRDAQGSSEKRTVGLRRRWCRVLSLAATHGPAAGAEKKVVQPDAAKGGSPVGA